MTRKSNLLWQGICYTKLHQLCIGIFIIIKTLIVEEYINLMSGLHTLTSFVCSQYTYIYLTLYLGYRRKLLSHFESNFAILLFSPYVRCREVKLTILWVFLLAIMQSDVTSFYITAYGKSNKSAIHYFLGVWGQDHNFPALFCH